MRTVWSSTFDWKLADIVQILFWSPTLFRSLSLGEEIRSLAPPKRFAHHDAPSLSPFRFAFSLFHYLINLIWLPRFQSVDGSLYWKNSLIYSVYYLQLKGVQWERYHARRRSSTWERYMLAEFWTNGMLQILLYPTLYLSLSGCRAERSATRASYSLLILIISTLLRFHSFPPLSTHEWKPNSSSYTLPILLIRHHVHDHHHLHRLQP